MPPGAQRFHWAMRLATVPPASVVGDDCVVTNTLDGPQRLYRLRR